MSVLLTGSGFLAKEVNSSFHKENVIKISREYVGDPSYLRKVIEENSVDFIIHTSWANVGGGSKEDFDLNLKVHNALCKVAPLVKKIFIFGSGVEILPLIKEREYYQKAKKVISESAYSQGNMINFRLFGCFGRYENSSRFIAQSVRRLREGLPVKVHQNRYMDFFYVGDLIQLIRYYMHTESHGPRVLDCVYPNCEYRDLKSIGEFLSFRYGKSNPVIFDVSGYNEAYQGDSSPIEALNLPFKGLIEGIKEIYG